jgi:parvulin-like peptidyl-prolyl isomerase
MLLKFLRKRKNMKRIMWALAILIIPAFVIWGSGTSMKDKQNKPDYAGKIFNKKISYEKYIDMWNVTRDYALKNFGENFPQDFIDKMAWDRLILLEEAKRQNLDVKDSEVLEQIASFPVFQRNGSFDKKTYKLTMTDQARDFEEKIRDDILVGKLREKIVSDVYITEAEVKNAYKENFEKIKLSYTALPFNAFEKDITYKDDDLIKTYNTDKESFKKPEQVNVRYVQILFSDFK